MNARYLIILLISILLFSCNSNLENNDKKTFKNISKISRTDIFKNTIVESDFFEINANKDNTIESKKGNIFIIEKGAFIDGNNNIVTDSIQIELAEASEIDELILSNLVIQDRNNIYQDNLSFYLNATKNGEQLKINPKKPIYFELASEKKTFLLKGNRDSIGNMNWGKQIDFVKELTPVPFDILDFYPESFETTIEKGLPFRNHKILTKELSDSLYYSFSTEIFKNGAYNWNCIGGYDKFLMINLSLPLINMFLQEDADTAVVLVSQSDTIPLSLCGINPASVKAIKNQKFRNTLLSTREFEKRLKAIFKTCDNKILELYINNLNKNLWEIDEMVAEQLGEKHKMYSTFKEFASYKNTTVSVSNKRAKLLSKFYTNKKQEIENNLLRQKKAFYNDKQIEKQKLEQKKNEYRKLLQKRLKYRMNKFGFELTELGWYNAVSKIHINDVEKFKLNTFVNNGNQFDRVYTYVINPKINSIFSLLSSDNINFNKNFSDDPHLLLWKNQKFDIISIGYKKDEISYIIGNYTQKPIVTANLNLKERSLKEFKRTLKKYTRNYNKENKIIVDLEYQAFFYKNKQKKKKEKQELEFKNNLRKIIFPCCDFNKKEDFEVITEIEEEY